MLAPYDIEKVVQATAVLLKLEPTKRMTRLRILKLLYIADREMIERRGRPITGDRVVAMDNGPVLSNTYDYIKGKTENDLWKRCLETVGRDVVLREDPGVGKLTPREVDKLQEVFSRLIELDDYAVADLTHDFPEYKKNTPPRGGQKPIAVDDILAAVGMAEHKESLEEEAACEFHQRQLSSLPRRQ